MRRSIETVATFLLTASNYTSRSLALMLGHFCSAK